MGKLHLVSYVSVTVFFSGALNVFRELLSILLCVQSINQFIEQKDRAATYIHMHEYM